MKKTKKNKGITLMSLVITIILLIILASIGTYSGVQVVKSARFTAFSTELKIMQTQVNKLYEDKKNDNTFNEPGTIITGKVKEQADKVFTESASGIINSDDYKYYDTDTIKSLNIEGVEGEFFVNIDKRSVISYEGFEYEGETYYTLDQLPDGLYNVEYNNTNNWDSSKDSFDIEYNEVEEGKYRITVSNIDYKSGNINKWQVKYKRENEDDWKTTNNYSFIIDKVGNYRVKIANNNTESREKQIIAKTLPSEYQEVEYIESTGTQYIDTRYYSNNNTNIMIAFNYNQTNNAGASNGMVFGSADESNGRPSISIGILNDDTLYYRNSDSAEIFSGNYKLSKQVVYEINCYKNQIVINGSNFTSQMSLITNPQIYSSYLFARHQPASIWDPSEYSILIGRIYYCKIFEENILQRNFIPCYSTTTVTDVAGVQVPANTKGMYDLVNNEFYTNQGTGDFSKGNDSDGGETINTIIINNM